MEIQYSPQINENKEFSYDYSVSNSIRITYREYEYTYLLPVINADNGMIAEEGRKEKTIIEELSDTLDLSSVDTSFDQVLTSVETDLPINPVIDIKVDGGEIKVRLLNFITSHATEDEKFPQEMEV